MLKLSTGLALAGLFVLALSASSGCVPGVGTLGDLLNQLTELSATNDDGNTNANDNGSVGDDDNSNGSDDAAGDDSSGDDSVSNDNGNDDSSGDDSVSNDNGNDDSSGDDDGSDDSNDDGDDDSSGDDGGSGDSDNSNSNSNGSGDTSGGTTGDVVAGQTIYENRCASCHSLGSFDSVGFAGNLSGRGNQLVADLSTISGAMSGLTLTSQEQTDLAAFLDAN